MKDRARRDRNDRASFLRSSSVRPMAFRFPFAAAFGLTFASNPADATFISMHPGPVRLLLEMARVAGHAKFFDDLLGVRSLFFSPLLVVCFLPQNRFGS